MNGYFYAFLAFLSLYLFLLKARTCGKNQSGCAKKRITLFSIHTAVFILLLTLFSRMWGITIESDNIDNILSYINQDSLVVFDLDDTVVRMPQELGSDTWFYEEAKKLVEKGLTFNQAVEDVLPLFCLIHHNINLELVEEKTTTLIKNLQKQNIKIIALTSRSIALIERTKEELSRLGVTFLKNNFEITDLALSVTHAGRYNDGIIFCANNNKGQMLFLFLEKVGFNPSNIIFIDDKMSHIEHVEKAVEAKEVPFVGLRYSGSDAYKIMFDKVAAEKQLNAFKIRMGIKPLLDEKRNFNGANECCTSAT